MPQHDASIGVVQPTHTNPSQLLDTGVACSHFFLTYGYELFVALKVREVLVEEMEVLLLLRCRLDSGGGDCLRC